MEKGGWKEVGELGKGVRSYTDGRAAAATDYSYRVRIRGPGGYSEYAGPCRLRTPGTPTPKVPPGRLVAAPRSPTEMFLAWSGEVSPDFTYAISRRKADENEADLGRTFTADARTMVISGLEPGTEYRFYVRVRTDAGKQLRQSYSKKRTPAGEGVAAGIGTIDFREFAIRSYAKRDKASSAKVEDEGGTLRLSGEAWRKIAVPCRVSADTILEFDFKRAAPGKTQGIALDSNDTYGTDTTWRFRLDGIGEDSEWVGSYRGAAAGGSGWRHCFIPVGGHRAGNLSFLIFVNTGGEGGPEGECLFRNVKLYELTAEGAVDPLELPPAPAGATAVVFKEDALEPYKPDHDKAPRVAVEEGGNALRLGGNAWKKIPLRYNVGPDTVLELDFRSAKPGERHGVGCEYEYKSRKYTRLFKLYGAERADNDTYADYEAFAPAERRYRIRLGLLFKGETRSLVFYTDHDVKEPTAESLFRNVKIYDLPGSQPDSRR
jgi:hypothetical protein